MAAIKAFVGLAFAVVIALLGITLWKVVERPADDQLARQLAAIEAKVEAATAAVAEVRKSATASGVAQSLSAIDAKIEKTNAAMAEVQKAAAQSATAAIDKSLGELRGKLDQTHASLAELQQGTSLTKVTELLNTLNTRIQSTDEALTKIQQAIPQNTVGDKIEAVTAKLDQVGASLADIKKTPAAADVSGAFAAPVADLTKVVSEASALRDRLNEQIARISEQAGKVGEQAAKVGEQAAKFETAVQSAVQSAARPKTSELMVVYLDMPDDKNLPPPVATVTPLTVQFKEIGSADAAGADAIVADLKKIVQGRSNCVISVAGFADTLGRDSHNLTISKRRANAVAERLKTAFDGQPVQINEAAWGERRLRQWTPDETAHLENRRVDVSVSCKG